MTKNSFMLFFLLSLILAIPIVSRHSIDKQALNPDGTFFVRASPSIDNNKIQPGQWIFYPESHAEYEKVRAYILSEMNKHDKKSKYSPGLLPDMKLNWMNEKCLIIMRKPDGTRIKIVAKNDKLYFSEDPHKANEWSFNYHVHRRTIKYKNIYWRLSGPIEHRKKILDSAILEVSNTIKRF